MKRNLVAVSCVLALVTLRAGFAIAEDAPADKAEKAAPAAAATAAAPAAKADPAAGDELVREARSFLTLVRDGADDKAYERMSAEFRKEHAAEQFTKDLNDFREKSPLPPAMAVSGDAWLKPKDGGPPRASLRASMARGAMFSGTFRPQGGLRMSMLTLSLVQEDGKWKVAALHDMRASDPAVAMGKAVKTDRKDPDRIKVSSTLEGTIVKFEDGTLVFRVEGAAKDAPASERTVKVDEQTVVMRGVEGEPVRLRTPAPEGAKAMPRSVRYSRGAVEDIKAERRASVELSDDGKRADCVMVIQNSEPNAPQEGL